jgi:hypothetical protein
MKKFTYMVSYCTIISIIAGFILISEIVITS